MFKIDREKQELQTPEPFKLLERDSIYVTVYMCAQPILIWTIDMIYSGPTLLTLVDTDLQPSSSLLQIMDIFGTIISAINLTKQICDYLQAVKDADDDRLNLCAEISELRALLNILHQGVSDQTDRSGLVQTGIQPALNQCLSALRFIDSKLKVPQHGSSRFHKLVKKLEWPFGRDEIQETLKKIERLKSLISLSLQTSLK